MRVGDWEVTYTTKNVNSKRLLGSVVAMVNDILDDSVATARSMAAHDENIGFVVESEMAEFEEKKVISQFDVICDQRNNSRAEIERGICHLQIKYRQMYCLNETQIDFTITVMNLRNEWDC